MNGSAYGPAVPVIVSEYVYVADFLGFGSPAGFKQELVADDGVFFLRC